MKGNKEENNIKRGKRGVKGRIDKRNGGLSGEQMEENGKTK